MTATPEQIAQVRLAADIMEKEWPWEYQSDDGEWRNGNSVWSSAVRAVPHYPIRRKQPAPIPLDALRALCGGQEPHRTDWTEDMLPPVTDGGLPWRPLALDEPQKENDEWLCVDEGWRKIAWIVEDDPSRPSDHHRRTRRPAPAAFWDCAEDVPGPVCWMRWKGNEAKPFMVIGFGEGVQYAGIDCICTAPWDSLPQAEWSPDRRNWRPCLKEVKAS